ncbi:MAG TPA: hypothetical protein VNB59_04725 [Solirubrobacterales bacterium]|jgi:hypothetical protein|nr:hypothetical protein [Solirubrobacterales bacterium]
MRRGVIVAIVGAMLAVTAVGVAVGAGRWTQVRAGNLLLEISGGVTPEALPKEEFAPLEIHASGRLSTTDGTHPPALKEAILDTDKDVIVSVKGLPVCRSGQLRARDTEAAEAVCGKTILGRGSATVEVAFPEQKPFEASGPLILFNGGERNGAVTMLAYTYVSVPAPTAVVATAKLTRIDKGPYGLHPVINVPVIAGGAGSVVKANITMGRIYTYKGQRHSAFAGRCRDGRIQARGTFRYRDGTSLSGGVVRTCTVRG